MTSPPKEISKPSAPSMEAFYATLQLLSHVLQSLLTVEPIPGLIITF